MRAADKGNEKQILIREGKCECSFEPDESSQQSRQPKLRDTVHHRARLLALVLSERVREQRGPNGGASDVSQWERQLHARENPAGSQLIGALSFCCCVVRVERTQMRNALNVTIESGIDVGQ